MRKQLLHLAGILGLVVSILILSGCGDNTAEVNRDTNSNDRDVPNLSDQVPADGCCILVPLGLKEYQVNKTGQFELAVALYSRQTGEPVEGQPIAWTLTGEGDASLSAFETVTDVNGEGYVTFRAGEELGTYTVEADHQDTAPVQFTVEVVNLPSGSLAVNVINSASSQLTVQPYDIALYYTQDLSCRHFSPLTFPQSGSLAMTEAQVDGDRITFENVLADFEYTVAGVGYGPNGNMVAKACIDEVVVDPDQTREVDLIFQLEPLNPVGTYKVRSFFDFGDAIAQTGTVGEWLVRIFDGFDNPGELLYNVIIDSCGLIAPGLLCDAIDAIAGLTGIKKDIQDFITDLVLSNETGCSIVRAGCDVRSAIRTMELLSNVYISKLGADFLLYGTTNFTGLAYYWRFNCTASDPPDCGRDEISYEDLLDLQLVSGDWEGAITGYDHLIINSHPVDLRYGKLISYLINQVILPRIADGATNFSDALEYWIGCDSFATWLSGIDILGASLSYNQAYGVCSGAVGLLGNILGFGSALLSLQEFSSVMTLNGEATLVELDGDFLVDEIHDGVWNGTLSFGDGTSPITGVWSGCRPGENGDCTYPPITPPLAGDMACRCDRMCNCSDP